MDIIQIDPIKLWTASGQIEADIIQFLASVYSFHEGTLNVNYQLKKMVIDGENTTYEYITGGAYLVPKDVVDEWSADAEIYDFVIKILGLIKVKLIS